MNGKVCKKCREGWCDHVLGVISVKWCGRGGDATTRKEINVRIGVVLVMQLVAWYEREELCGFCLAEALYRPTLV